ncbi:LysR family transcriptional regulator [Solimicrobium silvestre]|uniref:Transcriptional regulator n=1 Tax=Solimicrobium silvestre TaxID=2099400 RepID=A0A2S9H5I6_9BURK|nr:LysR family transcriptional regulator [Solimicrobium silvestre]PRC95218.1 Transcriptional regulator [Solimicrobium silvestre]
MSLPGQIDLNDLVIFDAVVESGGFTAAAERLGVAGAKVSLEIGRLEASLGTRLFTRTTRKVILTDAGLSLHQECQPLLRGLQEALNQYGSVKTELIGTLRISTTVDHATQSLGAALAQFSALHPKLQIDLRTGDRVLDLVGEGVDLAIRIGWLRDSSMHALKLGEFEQYMVASPEYLRRNKVPKHPEQLAELDWVALTLMKTPLTWQFTSKAGEEVQIHVKSHFKVDSPNALRTVLRNHAGISVLDQRSVQQDIEEGHLKRLLPDWTLPKGGIYAVYPAGRHVPQKVRAFIDFYRNYLIQKT